MQRSLFALSASLLIILVSLIALTWSREKPKGIGVETPMGVPPSQKILVEKPRVETHHDASDSTVATESVQAEPSEWVIVDVRARITHLGQPLSDAWMVARRITIRPDNGLRSALDLFSFSRLEGEQRSDQDGNVLKKVRYPSGIAENSLFGVGVFHSELGTAYDEISINDLSAGRVLDLEPELGEILVGKIIGANGEPIHNALVYVGTQTPSDAVCLSGLGARTGPDGSFIIPGFRFDNKLLSLHATAYSREYLPEEKLRITEQGTTMLLVNRDTDFNEQENKWTFSDMSVSTTKTVMDLATGELTTLQTDR